MARPGRPASESCKPACCSVSQSASYSSEAGIVGLDDRAPIFSLSKSSMDVVMVTGPMHKQDEAWTRTDLRRSFSTSTHSEQNSVKPKQLYPHVWRHANATNNLHNMGLHSPPSWSESWIDKMQRWSGCSGSTHSRSSTPETVVWRVGTSRPSSLTQDAPCSPVLDSPMSKLASPPTIPSQFISPLQTPTLPPTDLLTSASPLTLSRNKQDLLMSSPVPSPLPSSLQAHTSSPLTPSSPVHLQLTRTEDERFLENNLFTFQFLSPTPSSASLAEAGTSGPDCLVDNLIEELHSPGDMQLSESGGMRSPEQRFTYMMSNSSAEGQESGTGVSVCHLELPWQPGQSCPAGRGRRSPMVSSWSDSQLSDSCRCSLNSREGTAQAPKAEVFKEEGTMTSQLETADAAVQTMSPVSSWCNLRKNMSTSNMDSHSIFGSPPGFRMNHKSSVGSNSNLAFSFSSVFPVSSGEEEERQGDDPPCDVNSVSSHNLERKRSCLKIQEEERDELERRSSIKQMQWVKDSRACEAHGASVDPEVLSMAIRKHLGLQNSPLPQRRTSKKKKAPKPPLISNVVKVAAPELKPPVMISTSLAEGRSEGPAEAGGGMEEEKPGGGKKEETVKAAHRTSKVEGHNVKQEEEEGVYVEEAASHPKSPSHGSGHEKKSVIRSLRRPGWCGGSRKTDD